MNPPRPDLLPRLLTAAEAAAYFQLPRAQFERLDVGRISFGAKIRYDRVALDAFLDRIAGLSEAPASQDEASAALERIRRRLEGAPRRP